MSKKPLLTARRSLLATGMLLAVSCLPLSWAVPSGETVSRALLQPPLPALPTPATSVIQTPSVPPAPRPRAHALRPTVQASPVTVAAPTEPAPPAVVPESVSLPVPSAETGLAPETTDDFSLTETTPAAPAEANAPLDSFYQERDAHYGKYTSTGYLLKVFGFLALLLGGFYLLARTFVPRLFQPRDAEPSGPRGESGGDASAATPPPQSLLRSLFSAPKALLGDPAVQPQVLSRTRLGPTKEIHVIQVGGRRLVIGSTPQQMTLLTELPPETLATPPSRTRKNEGFASKRAVDPVEAVYRKYLETAPRSATPSAGPDRQSIPEEEEIYLLEDYDDEFERLS